MVPEPRLELGWPCGQGILSRIRQGGGSPWTPEGRTEGYPVPASRPCSHQVETLVRTVELGVATRDEALTTVESNYLRIANFGAFPRAIALS